MTTKRGKIRKTRKRSCKNGKLKNPIRTKNGGKRRCKKSVRTKTKKSKRRKRKKYKMMKRSKTMNKDPVTMRYGRLVFNPNLRLRREKQERPDIYPTEEEEARWTSRMIANVLRERKEEEERQARLNNEE